MIFTEKVLAATAAHAKKELAGLSQEHSIQEHILKYPVQPDSLTTTSKPSKT
jgi:hypothetical protein